MMNVGNDTLCRGDVEDATAAHGHFADIGSLLAADGYHRPHQVTRLEPPHPLVLFRAGTGKAVLVHAAHLPRAVSGCSDLQ